MLQVVSITRSSAYAAAQFFNGASASAIAAANASGKLNQVSAGFLLPPGNIPAGEADFISVEFKSIACGATAFFLPNDPADSALLDGREPTYGIPLAIHTVRGVVQACDPAARPTPKPTPTPRPTPVPTQAPTQAPIITSGPTPPETGGSVTPPPASEATASPSAAATPRQVSVVTPTRAPSARAASPDLSTVAFVGVGVAGVIAGFLVVMMIAAAMVMTLVIPFLVVRARGRRR